MRFVSILYHINYHDSEKLICSYLLERGNLPAVSALLQNGADFDAVDGDGNNALHIAVRESHLPVVRELVGSYLLLNIK